MSSKAEVRLVHSATTELPGHRHFEGSTHHPISQCLLEQARVGGGVLAYTKNVALRVAPFGANCNSLDPGGVLTPLNACVIEDPVLWEEIMQQTPLRRWASSEEIAQWAYFLTVVNRFATGQSIVVDGGEMINSHFVWKES